MPRTSRFHLLSVVPFVPLLVGLVLSTWRFRADDGAGGLAFGLGGMVLMIVLATRLPGPE